MEKKTRDALAVIGIFGFAIYLMIAIGFKSTKGRGFDWPLVSVGLKAEKREPPLITDGNGYVNWEATKTASTGVVRPITEEALQGTWEFSDVDSGLRTLGYMTLQPGGSFDAAMKLSDGKDEINVSLVGTWRLEGTRLYETIESTNRPDIIAVPRTTADEILSITTDTLTIKNADGEVETARRPKD